MAITKELIKQKIQEERGEYTRKRRKKFLYLKNTGQMRNYYMQKKIPLMPKLKPIMIRLNFWQRIYVVLVVGLKRLWRKLFRNEIQG